MYFYVLFIIVALLLVCAIRTNDSASASKTHVTQPAPLISCLALGMACCTATCASPCSRQLCCTSILYITLHHSTSLCISLHLSTSLCISLHLSTLTLASLCISLSLSLFLIRSLTPIPSHSLIPFHSLTLSLALSLSLALPLSLSLTHSLILPHILTPSLPRSLIPLLARSLALSVSLSLSLLSLSLFLARALCTCYLSPPSLHSSIHLHNYHPLLTYLAGHFDPRCLTDQ